jgi:hypothetical protein
LDRGQVRSIHLPVFCGFVLHRVPAGRDQIARARVRVLDRLCSDRPPCVLALPLVR